MLPSATRDRRVVIVGDQLAQVAEAVGDDVEDRAIGGERHVLLEPGRCAGPAAATPSRLSGACSPLRIRSSVDLPAAVPADHRDALARVRSAAWRRRAAAGVRRRATPGRGQRGASRAYATAWRTTAPVRVSVPSDRYSSRSATDSANSMRRSRRATSGGNETPVDRVQFNRLGAVDPLAGEPADELRRIVVRVDRDARRGLAGLVQPGRVRHPDVDPRRASRPSDRERRSTAPRGPTGPGRRRCRR